MDFIRAIAILTVVLSHSSIFLAPLTALPRAGHAIDVFLKNMFPLALLGVELFFVLSGFLIGNILIKTFVQTDFAFGDVRNFWIRRWFRTLPNYWLILTAELLLYYYLNLTSLDAAKLLYYPFLQNLWYPHPIFFFGEAWSLSVEEWFYLTLPVVMFVCARVFGAKEKRVFLLRVFSFYLLVFIIARFVNAFHPMHGPDQDAGIRKVVVFRLDAVMFGVLFAWLAYFKNDLLEKLKYVLLAVSIAGTGVIFYLVASPTISIVAPVDPSLKFASDAFLYLAIPLVFSCCLPFANGVKSIGEHFFSKGVRHISKISYSMYLVHYSLVFIPFFFLHKVASHKMIVVLYLLYWVIVIVLSSLLYRFFEQPIMKLRDRISVK